MMIFQTLCIYVKRFIIPNTTLKVYNIYDIFCILKNRSFWGLLQGENPLYGEFRWENFFWCLMELIKFGLIYILTLLCITICSHVLCVRDRTYSACGVCALRMYSSTHVNIYLFDYYWRQIIYFTTIFVHAFSGVHDRTSIACGERACTREYV